jgi:hypothetical protein
MNRKSIATVIISLHGILAILVVLRYFRDIHNLTSPMIPAIVRDELTASFLFDMLSVTIALLISLIFYLLSKNLLTIIISSSAILFTFMYNIW